MSKEKGGEKAKKNNENKASSPVNEAGSSTIPTVLREPISPPEGSSSEPQALDLRKNKRSITANPTSVLQQPPPPQTPFLSENPTSTAPDFKLCEWCKTEIVPGQCDNNNFCKDTCFESYRRCHYKRRSRCIICGLRGDWEFGEIGFTNDSLENLPERACSLCIAQNPELKMDPNRIRRSTSSSSTNNVVREETPAISELSVTITPAPRPPQSSSAAVARNSQPRPVSIIQPLMENQQQFPQSNIPNLDNGSRLYPPTPTNYQNSLNIQSIPIRNESVTSHTVSAPRITTTGENNDPYGVAQHTRLRSCVYEPYLSELQSPNASSVSQPNSYPLNNPWSVDVIPTQTERISTSLPPPRIFGASGNQAARYMRYHNTPPPPPTVPERRRHLPSSTVTSDTSPPTHSSSPAPGMLAHSPTIVAEPRMRRAPTPTGDERRIVVMLNPYALPTLAESDNLQYPLKPQLMHLYDTQPAPEETPTTDYNHLLSIQIPPSGGDLPPIETFYRGYNKKARFDEGDGGDRRPPSSQSSHNRMLSYAATPQPPYIPGMHLSWFNYNGNPPDFSSKLNSDGSTSNESCSYGTSEILPSPADHRQQDYPNGNSHEDTPLLRKADSPRPPPSQIPLAPAAPPPNDCMFSNIVGQHCPTPLPSYRHVSSAEAARRPAQGRRPPGKKESKASSSDKGRRRGRQANVQRSIPEPTDNNVAIVPDTNQGPTSTTTVNASGMVGAANDPHCSYNHDVPIKTDDSQHPPLPETDAPRSKPKTRDAPVATVIQGPGETMPHGIPYPIPVPYAFPVNDTIYDSMADLTRAVTNETLNRFSSAVAAFAGSTAAMAVAQACNSLLSNNEISVNQLGTITPSSSRSSLGSNVGLPGPTNNKNKGQSKSAKSPKEKKSKKTGNSTQTSMAQGQSSNGINDNIRSGGADSNAGPGGGVTGSAGTPAANAGTDGGVTANPGTDGGVAAKPGTAAAHAETSGGVVANEAVAENRAGETSNGTEVNIGGNQNVVQGQEYTFAIRDNQEIVLEIRDVKNKGDEDPQKK